jgi:heme/copper-type cytochrome/quinol oxidase subunit 3
LLATIVLGAVFLVGQATEYVHLVNNSVTIDVDVFASSYYTLTGAHDFHVLAGLIVLLVVLGLAQAGDFRHGAHADAVDSISWYWYFVIGLWVVNFALIYLWTLFQ